MGYLHAPGLADPEATEKGEKISRAEMIQREGDEPDFPPLEPGGFLFELWFEAGCISSSASGPIPLEWQQIEAFSRLAGLHTYEARLMRAMSEAYLDGRRIGMSPLGIAPWQGDDD